MRMMFFCDNIFSNDLKVKAALSTIQYGTRDILSSDFVNRVTNRNNQDVSTVCEEDVLVVDHDSNRTFFDCFNKLCDSKKHNLVINTNFTWVDLEALKTAFRSNHCVRVLVPTEKFTEHVDICISNNLIKLLPYIGIIPRLYLIDSDEVKEGIITIPSSELYSNINS